MFWNRLRNSDSERCTISDGQFTGSLRGDVGDNDGNGKCRNGAIYVCMEHRCNDAIDHSFDRRKLQCNGDRLQRMFRNGLRNADGESTPNSDGQFTYSLLRHIDDNDGNRNRWNSAVHIFMEYRSDDAIDHSINCRKLHCNGHGF